MQDPKTFLYILSEFHKDQKLIHKYLKDQRLTQVEKIILQHWLDLKEAKFDLIVSSLENIETKLPDLIESQKALLLGITFNNKSEPLKALLHLKNAKDLLEKHPKLKRLQYICAYNLFIVGVNLKQKLIMDQGLESMLEFTSKSLEDEAGVNLCLFIHMKFLGLYKEAEDKLKSLKLMAPLLGPGFKLTLNIEEFDFLVKTNQLQKAKGQLDIIKKIRSYHYGANFKFMDILINYLIDDKNIYVYDKFFKDHPLLYHQIMTIKHLDQHQRDEARSHWLELQKINHHIYQDEFKFEGDTCLFSRSLEKSQENSAYKKNLSIEPPPTATLEEKIHHVFQKTNSITREELFYQLWPDEEPHKLSFNKLSRLISRYNQRYNQNITFQKGVYQSLKKKSA